MEFADQELASKTKKVLIVSIISAAFSIIWAIAYLAAGGGSSGAGIAGTIIGTGLNLLVPICGFVGSLQKNRQLICLFCGFSIALAVLWIINMISSVSITHTPAGAWCTLNFNTCSANLEPAESGPSSPACRLANISTDFICYSITSSGHDLDLKRRLNMHHRVAVALRNPIGLTSWQLSRVWRRPFP